MTAVPEMGHFIPLVRLAECLEKAGHRITFVTFNYKRDRCDTMI